MMDDVIERTIAPWTEDQVKALNLYQTESHWHPYTCGNNRHDKAHVEYQKQHSEQDWGQLVATKDGWICPVPGCDYKQKWASKFMLDLGLELLKKKSEQQQS